MKRPVLASLLALLAASAALAEETPAPAPEAPPAAPEATPAAPEPDAAPAAVPEAPPAAPEPAAAAAAAAPVVAAEAPPAEKAEPFPVHMSASVGNYLGTATFIGGYHEAAYVGSSLSLSPSFSMWGFTLAASQGLEVEWTPGSTTYPNQLMYGDTGLSASYSGLKLDDLGLAFSVSGGADLPISLRSRHVGKITNLSLGGRGSWSMAGFSLSAGLGGNYNITVGALSAPSRNDAVNPYQDRSLGEVTPSGYVVRTPTDCDNYGCGAGLPSLLGYNANVGAGYSLFDGALSFGTSLAFIQAFTFAGADDEFTPAGAQTGFLQWRMPMTSASLSASYTPIEWFTLSTGLSTTQPIVSHYADGFAYVNWFPYWNFFDRGVGGYSSLFVETSFSI